LIILLC